jgi:hypothetical protein
MKEFKKNEQGLFVCEECGKQCKNKQGLGNHIYHHHNDNEYYDKWLKESHEALCCICGKETKFIGIKAHGYSKYCSKKCITVETSKHNLEKYGTKCTLNIDENIRKKKQTWMKNYGVDNPSKSTKIKNQKEKTLMIHYGVPYSFQDAKIIEKAQKTALTLKHFKNTNIWYQGSYELDFLEKYYDSYPEICRGPSVKFIHKNKKHVYYPDFYIPSLNLIIECKNSYLLERDKDIIEAKEKATIANGYNYVMIVDKNYVKLNIL